MYAKVFRQIFESSIAENPELRFTFMDLLVLADSDGVVDMTPESIARITNRPLDIIKATISELESPDCRSRTPDADGRRLKRLDDHRDWGWVILNYDKFRAIASEEQRKEKTRLRVRKLRENRRKVEDVTQCNAPVTPRDAGNAMQREKQMQREKHKEGEGNPPGTISMAERITREKELERVDAAIKDIRTRNGTPPWPEPEREKIGKLKGRRTELLSALGMMV